MNDDTQMSGTCLALAPDLATSFCVDANPKMPHWIAQGPAAVKGRQGGTEG